MYPGGRARWFYLGPTVGVGEISAIGGKVGLQIPFSKLFGLDIHLCSGIFGEGVFVSVNGGVNFTFGK